MAAQAGFAPTPFRLTGGRTTVIRLSNGAAGRILTCISPLRRRMPHILGHGSTQMVSAAGRAPAIARSQAEHVAPTPRADGPDGCYIRAAETQDANPGQRPAVRF